MPGPPRLSPSWTPTGSTSAPACSRATTARRGTSSRPSASIAGPPTRRCGSTRRRRRWSPSTARWPRPRPWDAGRTTRRSGACTVERGAVRYDSIGDFPGARADWDIALRAAREVGDRALEVDTLTAIAAAERVDDFEARDTHQLEALAAARASGSPELEAGALGRLSIGYSNVLRLDAALDNGYAAMAIAEGTGDPMQRVAALDALKLAALMLGDLPRLDALCRELVDLLSGLPDEGYAPNARLGRVPRLVPARVVVRPRRVRALGRGARPDRRGPGRAATGRLSHARGSVPRDPGPPAASPGRRGGGARDRG